MKIINKTAKRAFSFTTAGLMMGIMATTANAADIKVNLGYAAPQASSYGILASKFEELAEKYSDGSIDIKIRCCTQLSTEGEAVKAMQLGTVDMYILTSNTISPHFPLMEAFDLPYIFQSEKHSYDVLDGPVGKKFAAKLQSDTKLSLLTYGYVEYRDFYNSERPINSIEDMKGLKVRVPKNQVYIATHDAFGSSPLPIPWSETLAALQTGTVVGGDSGASFIKSQKFYELAKNDAVLEHLAFFTPMLASPRIMKKMSDSQKDAIYRAAQEAGQYQREEMARQIADARVFLSEQGMNITYPDKADFIKAGLNVQDQFAQRRGDEFRTLLEDIRKVAQ